jgi:polyphosphate kinase
MNFKEPKYYINRDLSWIEFNRKVLDEALDRSLPLLERVKFLSIFCTNLDEFYMIRVSGLKEQVALNLFNVGIDGLSPVETLKKIESKVRPMLKTFMECYKNDILPQLKEEGIEILEYSQLTNSEKECLKAYFEKEIYPVLTPLAFDPGRPFPHISNLSLSLAILIEKTDGERHFARVKIPRTLPRFVSIDLIQKKYKRELYSNGKARFTLIDQVIQANLDSLFPKMKVIESFIFRVTRDTDIEIQEDEADDLLKIIEENIRQRRFGAVVRLEIESELSPVIKNLLMKNLEIDENSVHVLNCPLGLGELISLLDLPYQDLKVKPFYPITPKIFEEEKDIFSAIRRNDILLNHPYHTFLPVIDFIKTASNDPNVLAIKQTLYRVGPNSPIVESLIEAAENGKQVAVLVELKARFDEENNIHWARRLEKVGVHVVYGLIGLKTHCKVVLVVRKERDALRRYVHLGTGNYNTQTAKIYTDFGLFTCNENIAGDASALFNYLTGYSEQDIYRELLVAPINMRERLLDLVDNEIQSHKKSGNGRLIFKMNSLTDPKMIQALYKASCEGVKIDLLVRGICMLRPQLKDISENIQVISIVGRFLEHSRIFYFGNNRKPIIYLGSADLMERNLNRRVEILFPINGNNIKKFIIENVLSVQLNDNFNARTLLPDGSYEFVNRKNGTDLSDSQMIQIKTAADIQSWDSVLEL